MSIVGKKKKILIKAPLLSRSGYGEHTRFLLRSLRAYENSFDIYAVTTNWGNTGWLWEDDKQIIEIYATKEWACQGEDGYFVLGVNEL